MTATQTTTKPTSREALLNAKLMVANLEHLIKELLSLTRMLDHRDEEYEEAEHEAQVAVEKAMLAVDAALPDNSYQFELVLDTQDTEYELEMLLEDIFEAGDELDGELNDIG
jgi:hypothetical protein